MLFKILKKIIKNRVFIALLSFMSVSYAFSQTYLLPRKGNDIVGNIKIVRAHHGDTIVRLARRYDMGYFELIEANPQIAKKGLIAGKSYIIPSKYILPTGQRHGIVINLAEMRMYYYPSSGRVVETYPVGIGRQGWRTPVGKTYIQLKLKHPTWWVPKNILAAKAQQGLYLPKSIPPGPDNPLGDYAMRLGMPGYLLHSTNDPSGVGRRSSSGCIRMYPEDMERFYDQVKLNTPVRIINRPYKLGWSHHRLFIESHLPLQENASRYRDDNQLHDMVKVTLSQHRVKKRVNWHSLSWYAHRHAGIPTHIPFKH